MQNSKIKIDYKEEENKEQHEKKTSDQSTSAQLVKFLRFTFQ
jgi:hypothetical protein